MLINSRPTIWPTPSLPHTSQEGSWTEGNSVATSSQLPTCWKYKDSLFVCACFVSASVSSVCVCQSTHLFRVITPPGEPQHQPDKWGIGGATLHSGWGGRRGTGLYLRHGEPKQGVKQEVGVFHAPSGGSPVVMTLWAVAMETPPTQTECWCRATSTGFVNEPAAALALVEEKVVLFLCFIPSYEAKEPTKTLAVIRSGASCLHAQLCAFLIIETAADLRLDSTR